MSNRKQEEHHKTHTSNLCFEHVVDSCSVALRSARSRLSGRRHMSRSLISVVLMLSRCLGDDEDAHEEDHDKKYPHKKPVHHLSDLLPLCDLDRSGFLLAEAICNELDVLHHLRKKPGDQGMHLGKYQKEK